MGPNPYGYYTAEPYLNIYYFPDAHWAAAQLATSAAAKLKHSFRPTLKQYNRLWADFLAFQVAAGLPAKVTVDLGLTFRSDFFN